jgi:O-antigen/teichoic acid export membrane protein
MPAMVKQPNSNMLISNSIRGRVLRAVSVVRLKPFDASTSEGRSNERLRRVFWTATTLALAKAVNTLAVLVSVPITLGYLGTERYGLWMAITSIVAFLGFADLGIGNVILNLVSESHGKDDVEAARKSISSALFMLIVISVGLASLFALIYPHVGWDRFFNVSSPTARKEAGPAVAVFVACFLINLPLSIVSRIQMGYQEGYVSSIWQGIANLLGLAGLVVIVHQKAGLPWLVLVITGAPALGNLLNGISLFAFQRPWLIPRRQDIDALIVRQIVWVGFLFLVLQVANAIVYSSDNIIIARVLGPEAVTNYAVPSRLFIIVPNMLYMVLAPLWPAYGEANARGDDSWVPHRLW